MKNKESLFIYNIVPIIRIGLSYRQYYSYVSDQKIKPGALVKIPLFNRLVEGIVIEKELNYSRTKNIHLKNISQIVEEDFLDEKQLNLAQFISAYYFCPLGVVLKFFAVKPAKMRNVRRGAQIEILTKKRRNTIILTREQQMAVDKIIKDSSKFLLFGPSSSGKTEIYIDAISRLKKKNTGFQFLILLPELTLASQAIEKYRARFDFKEIAILHSKLSAGEFYNYWQKIKSGEAKIIIGTRMAIFAPFRKLKLIVIDEEQDISFKQWEMNPRYDARTVAEKLAQIHQATIIRGSATPLVESYYKAINGEYKLLELPMLKTSDIKQQVQNARIEIVDMKMEYSRNAKNDLSNKLLMEIKNALSKKRQILIFINRKGMSAFSICSCCGKLLICPKCKRALNVNSIGSYHCACCSYKRELFFRCENCGSMKTKNIGIGTQKIKKQLKQEFPAHKIKLLDASSSRIKNKIEEIYDEFTHGKIDILIGTQMITKGWDNANLGVVGIVDADSLFSIPDVFADQRGFGHLMQVAGRTSRLGSREPGVVVVQTYKPEFEIFNFLKNRNYKGFYAAEIEKRKKINYPPFKKILKLICRDKKAYRVEKEAQKLYNEVKQIAEKNDYFITLPHQPLVSKSKNFFERQIIIKCSINLDAEISKIISKLGTNWIIDIDPISTS